MDQLVEPFLVVISNDLMVTYNEIFVLEEEVRRVPMVVKVLKPVIVKEELIVWLWMLTVSGVLELIVMEAH